MGDISLEVLELFSRVQHYLTYQKKNPESAMALEKSLIDHINILTHQDLMTPVPSGDNLLEHFILILKENDALTRHNSFILSALIQKSLSFRLDYPHLPDATTFLLTSSNQNNQTPFQLIDSLQSKGLLGFYLKHVERHLSGPLVPDDVITNKCTPWSCPLASSVLFFEELRSDGFRLLDRLVLLDATEHFINALDVLRAAFTGGYISGDAYKNVLLTHPKPNHSLLHELTMAGNVDKLEAYLRAINTMHREHVIDTDEYKNIFCVFNRAGYSAVHQAVNAPNEDIARSFLFFLENKCSLPESQQKEMFEVRSINRKAVLPRRDKAKQDASVDEINHEMTRLSRVWQVGEQAQYLQVQGLFSVSNPAPLKIEIEIESEATETGSWSPWMSPLLWLPSSLK
jgi:hypothetical protein